MKNLVKQFVLFPIYLYVHLFVKYYVEKYCLVELLNKDTERLCDAWKVQSKGYKAMTDLFLNKETCFRDILYWRCKYRCKALLWIFNRYPNLIFSGSMEAEGGAFLFYHPFCTIINASYIGYGCTFRNNTTIGNKVSNGELKRPVLGGGNDLGVSSLVIGDITLGKGAIIGAGSVVVKNVPENSVVAGNPARLLKIDGKKV